MTLYKLTTAELGDYYVVANHPTEAENFLNDKLNEADYGFRSHRAVINIVVITNEIYGRDSKSLSFNPYNRLLICPQAESATTEEPHIKTN